MAKEIQFPTGNERLDSFMMNVVWRRDASVRVYNKQTSALMWTLYIIGLMWLWQLEFFNNYNTVIGRRVYIREGLVLLEDWDAVYRVMRHEYIHILQQRKYGVLYDVAYLFPQVLAVFSLFALLAVWFSIHWLWALSFLIFLLPLPAYWRMKFEMEGYTQTMLVFYEETGQVTDELIGRIAEKFTGAAYYFMWPFRGAARYRLWRISKRICDGRINTPHLRYFY